MGQQVDVRVEVLGLPADQVYAVLRDFGRYPEITELVRSVDVRPGADGGTESSWAVSFGRGTLEWLERDEFDADRRTIRFEAFGGDPEVFRGEWAVLPAERRPGDSVVTFSAEFDLGIPTIGTVLDPIAHRLLSDTVTSLVGTLAQEHGGTVPAIG